MDNIHALSLKLFTVLKQYEDGLKENMDFTEAKELRKKIIELQSELEKERETLKVQVLSAHACVGGASDIPATQ